MKRFACLMLLSVGLLFGVNTTAAPLVSWSITGPGTINATQDVGNPNIWELDYNLNPAGFNTQTWTVTATAPVAGDYDFDWNYSGYHAFFNVTAFLNTFNPSSSQYSGGPASCCVGPPSGGFNESGSFSFTGVGAGANFGFTMGGKNGDSDNRLIGTLRLTQDVPEPGTALLLGAGLVLSGFGFRKNAR